MSSPQTQPTGKAGRYQRSVTGLVTSLVVTVIGLGALLYFTGIFRNDLEIKPEAIDYLETVESAQQAGLVPVYPATLPEGWIATGVEIEPGDDPVFMLRMLTDENRFVAVRKEDATIPGMLAAWVDDEAQVADGYTVPDDVQSPVARTWKGYTDEGGDTAFGAELGEETLLVFGSAPAEDLQAIIDSLVATPID